MLILQKNSRRSAHVAKQTNKNVAEAMNSVLNVLMPVNLKINVKKLAAMMKKKKTKNQRKKYTQELSLKNGVVLL